MDVDRVMTVIVHHAFLAGKKGSQELANETYDRLWRC